MDYNLIFAVSELLLFYESVSDFDGDGAVVMMVMKTVMTKVEDAGACPCWRAVSVLDI